jgi:hypothetical protein
MANAFTTSRGAPIGASLVGFSLTGDAKQPQRVAGLNKSQAEDLLDWLEANGYRDCHLAYTPGKGFTISYTDG